MKVVRKFVVCGVINNNCKVKPLEWIDQRSSSFLKQAAFKVPQHLGWQLICMGLSLSPLWAIQAAKAQVNSETMSQAVPEVQADRLKPPAPTVAEWKAQIAQSLLRVTGVKVEATEAGLNVVLVTEGQALPVPVTRVEGNVLIADISNATLLEAFEQANPAAGIALVKVSSLPGDRVQVAITGTNTPPTAQISSVAQGLTVAVSPGVTAGGEEEEEIEVVVTGERERERGYVVPNATTATKTDTPLRDIPFSVQAVPEQVLKDRQVRRLTDALQGVSGITTNQPETSLFEGFIIRGFNTGNSTLRNGILDTSTGTAGSGVVNVDRVEVLKGPAGALFGQGSPGGTVNIVTKKPLSRSLYDVEASVGNFNSYEGKIDVSQPLNADKTLLSRFTASANTYQGFSEFNPNNRYFISPVLTWLISKDTKLTFEAEYLNTKNPVGNALPAIGTVLPNPNGRIPYNRYTGEPSVDERNISVFRIGYDLEHRLNDNWQIRNAFRASFERNQSSAIFLDELLADDRTLTRDLQVSDDPVARYQLDTYVVGDVKTGSIEHKLLFGVNLSRDVATNNGTKQFEIAPIDLFNPVYGRQTVGPLINEFFKDTAQVNDGLGVYFQDQITIAKNFKILLGGRLDISSQKLEDNFKQDGDDTSFQQDMAFSPRIGLVYQPSENISLYGSYSSSFQPVIGRTFNGELFKPERGTQYEVGIKADWLDRKLTTTLAFYQLTRSNVQTSDLDNPGFQIQTGEQKSQGVELDIAGEILPGWKVIAGYAYNDVRISKDNTFAVGNRIDGIPAHSLSLFTTYEIQAGNLKGLGFGLGLTAVSDRPGNLDNTYTAPGYFSTDVALYYRRDRFRAALNIKNLFNQEYVRYISGDFVENASPLQAQFTLGWEF